MTIDLARLRSIERWVLSLGPPRFFAGFFPGGAGPVAGVGPHRVTVTSLFEHNSRPNMQHAELFDDGAGFACKRLFDPRTGSFGHQSGTIMVLNESLLWELGRCIHLLCQHAVDNSGAWGDALVAAAVVGERMQLSYLQRLAGGFGVSEPIADGRELDRADSRHTFVIEAGARVGQPLSATVRLVATDLFHAFGSPEVRQIAADGMLRTRYLGNGDLRGWTDASGIAMSDEVIPGE